MQCGFILAMQIFMWARKKQNQREKLGLVVTWPLVLRHGFTLALATGCLCDLGAVTLTSAPAAGKMLELARTPFGMHCLGLGQCRGDKELCNPAGSLKHFDDVVMAENYSDLSWGRSSQFVQYCAWFAGVFWLLLQCKQWSAFSK